MSQKEGDDLASDRAEVAVAAYAGDELQFCGGRDVVRCIWIERRAGRDSGLWVVGRSSRARWIEE